MNQPVSHGAIERRAARTTVICAVWNQDPLRHSLLAGHQHNLDAQTVPVNRIYVLDAGDQPPAGLRGTVVSVSDSLTIYQAWNVALSLVSTPYVMNLNLDDRLAPDAVSRLEAVLDAQEKVGIVGGDWRICYTQESTDQVQPCSPVTEVPYSPDWPPVVGTITRLGSGDGIRGTLGPACLWRLAAHVQAPRYPWRFSDGRLIKTIGDVLWWQLVQRRVGMAAGRVPLVIGNYFSHPDAQAEFRNPSDSEREHFDKVGLSLI